MKDVRIGDLTVGNDRPLTLIAGPCQLESLDHAQMIAGTMAEACAAAGAQYVFKASYDKANRTSLAGRRGMGMEAGLKVLQSGARIRSSKSPTPAKSLPPPLMQTSRIDGNCASILPKFVRHDPAASSSARAPFSPIA